MQLASFLIMKCPEMKKAHKKSAFTFVVAKSIGGNIWFYAVLSIMKNAAIHS